MSKLNRYKRLINKDDENDIKNKSLLYTLSLNIFVATLLLSCVWLSDTLSIHIYNDSIDGNYYFDDIWLLQNNESIEIDKDKIKDSIKQFYDKYKIQIYISIADLEKLDSIHNISKLAIMDNHMSPNRFLFTFGVLDGKINFIQSSSIPVTSEEAISIEVLEDMVEILSDNLNYSSTIDYEIFNDSINSVRLETAEYVKDLLKINVTITLLNTLVLCVLVAVKVRKSIKEF